LAFQQANPKALVRVLLRATILIYKEFYGFEDSTRTSLPRRDGGDGCEDPASELHRCVKGEVVKKIGGLIG
jgi:hypothetical protein